jgi:hypothetical protein
MHHIFNEYLFTVNIFFRYFYLFKIINKILLMFGAISEYNFSNNLKDSHLITDSDQVTVL